MMVDFWRPVAFGFFSVMWMVAGCVDGPHPPSPVAPTAAVDPTHQDVADGGLGLISRSRHPGSADSADAARALLDVFRRRVPAPADPADYVIDLTGSGEERRFGLGLDLHVGQRLQLRTQHDGVDRTNETTWTSNNASVADFPDTPGRIRGVSPGTAWIMARWRDRFRTLRVVVAASTGNFSVTEPLTRLQWYQDDRVCVEATINNHGTEAERYLRTWTRIHDNAGTLLALEKISPTGHLAGGASWRGCIVDISGHVPTVAAYYTVELRDSDGVPLPCSTGCGTRIDW